jgi:hypothetical protein
MATVSDEDYCNVIPEDMSYSKLNTIYYEVFGVGPTEIVLTRNLFDSKKIIITDFASNGFFWAQLQQEAVKYKARGVLFFKFLNAFSY